MKVEFIPCYRTPYGTVEFIPEANVPGYTHRVVVRAPVQTVNLQCQRLWVPKSMRVDRKSTAIHFMRIWCALQEGRERNYYVDRKEDPPLPSPALPPAAVLTPDAGYELPAR